MGGGAGSSTHDKFYRQSIRVHPFGKVFDPPPPPPPHAYEELNQTPSQVLSEIGCVIESSHIFGPTVYANAFLCIRSYAPRIESKLIVSSKTRTETKKPSPKHIPVHVTERNENMTGRNSRKTQKRHRQLNIQGRSYVNANTHLRTR